MELSVIIPTYNRKNKLKKCLNALFNQSYSQSDYEIIVVDDGSTDGTGELVKSMIDNSPCRLYYFKQKNRGPSATRNLGIIHASGKICLFLGDDIEASERLVEEHLACHEKFGDNVACLGWTKCHPDLKFTPFMIHISNIGPHFDPSSIKDNLEDLPFRYFVTANISVARARLLEAGLFDEDFKYPAYEDLELGYRLKQRGLKIILALKAVAYHNHQMNLNKYCKRQFNVGGAAVIFHRKHPEIEDLERIIRNKDGILDVLKSSQVVVNKLREIIKRMLSNKLTISLLKKLIILFMFLRLKIFYKFCFTLVSRYYLVMGILEEEANEKRKQGGQVIRNEAINE